MKKNYLSITFMISAICMPIIGCSSKTDLPQAKLFYAYSTENLMSDWNYFDTSEDFIEENEPYLNRDYTMRFNCLKGENEASQLMIYANEYINDFSFTAPTLKCGDKTIDASHFDVSAAWYMDVQGTKEKSSYSGLYPDALIPLENYKFRRMNHIEAGHNQSIYINLLTTKDMEPGTYTGSGLLTLDNQTYDIPFEVTIYDAILPEAKHNESCFLIWYELIGNGEKRNDTPELEMKYYDFLVSKRINPDDFPDAYQNSTQEIVDLYYEKVANNPMITNYRIATAGNGDGFNIDKAKEILDAFIKKNIEVRQAGDTECNFFKKFLFYVDDEPSAETYQRVKKHDKDLFDLKMSLASKLDAYPDLKESFIKIKNLVTIGYQEGLKATNETGGVQTWCPQFQHFNSKENRETYRQRQASTDRTGGENVWWYGCESPVSPYPSFHLDADLITSRVRTWMQYDYHIEGEIYWNMCYYQKYANGFETSRDIWHDPISWGRTAGDGYLVFPGVDFGINGPITTLRLESILASEEEYEYLWMIEQKVNEYNSLHSTSYDTRELLNKYFTKIYKNVTPYLDDDVFNDTRIEVIKVVEALSKNLDEGMKLLLNK